MKYRHALRVLKNSGDVTSVLDEETIKHHEIQTDTESRSATIVDIPALSVEQSRVLAYKNGITTLEDVMETDNGTICATLGKSNEDVEKITNQARQLVRLNNLFSETNTE